MCHRTASQATLRPCQRSVCASSTASSRATRTTRSIRLPCGAAASATRTPSCTSTGLRRSSWTRPETRRRPGWDSTPCCETGRAWPSSRSRSEIRFRYEGSGPSESEDPDGALDTNGAEPALLPDVDAIVRRHRTDYLLRNPSFHVSDAVREMIDEIVAFRADASSLPEAAGNVLRILVRSFADGQGTVDRASLLAVAERLDVDEGSWRPCRSSPRGRQRPTHLPVAASIAGPSGCGCRKR